jgi:dipeptidyl aminopeptidase/acylaminoacyl peptidase
MSKKVAPYGSWKSPITSDLIVRGTVGLTEIAIAGEEVYWIESRPSEAGRSVIVSRSADGHTSDVTPPPFNARTRVHEYGGGSYLVFDGRVYFSNFADQKIYYHAQGDEPKPLVWAPDFQYADAIVDHKRRRLIAVREDHTAHTRDTIDAIVAISVEGEESGRVLVSGRDFYSSPRLSPNGKLLAWLEWNHPNLPWDGTELWVGELDDDGWVVGKEMVAGGASESVFQPEWSPEGVLYFVSDQTGWWNLYRRGATGSEPMCEMEAEFGGPQWAFRMSTYAFESESRIILAYTRRGSWSLASLDTRTKRLEPLGVPYTYISNVRAAAGRAVFCGGSPAEPLSVVELNLETRKIEALRRSSKAEVDGEYLSVPEAIEFPTSGGQTAHAFFYAPKNRDYEGSPEERPPLLVISHGGPTSAAVTTLSLSIQYWTSRGIAVLDVNYGGSTGYGRQYRERLNGQWGVVDVEDCINGARYLVEQGRADADRLIIRGGSAGGYTTLAALTFHDFFKAGASYYGVSDLEALERDCHKFESQYNHTLIGPYPERRDLYVERSPIHFTDRLSCPVILFQGLEDKVVPPNQSEMVYEALKAKGIPVAYVPFEGEQHGFRKAENIKNSLDGELYFYSRVFGFEADVEPDRSIVERFQNFPLLQV